MAEENQSTAKNSIKRGRKKDITAERINQINNDNEHFSSFFRVMIGNYKDSLALPKKIDSEFGGSVPRNLFLRDSNGGSWKVKLVKKNDSFWLEEGWKTFILDHSITVGEFLVFTYTGNSTFAVKIYGISTLERLHFKENSIKRADCCKKRKTFNNSDSNIKLQKCESSKKVREIILDEPNEINVKEEVIEPETTKVSQLPMCIVVPYELVQNSRENMKLYDLFGHSFVPPDSYESEVKVWIEMKESAPKFLSSCDGVCHVVEETLVYDIPCEMKNNECNIEIATSDLPCTKMTGGMRTMVKSKVTPSLKKKITEATGGISGIEGTSPPDFEDFCFSLAITEMSSWVLLPMKLPAEIVKVIDGRTVILISDPASRVWPVFYYEDAESAGFFHGWQNFSKANELQTGDKCEFKVVQGSEFMLITTILRA